MYKNIHEILGIGRADAFKAFTGLNTPSKLEELSGLYIMKAGTRYFPNGFIYDERKNRHWEWLAVLEGVLEISWGRQQTKIQTGECYMMPPDVFLQAIPDGSPPLLTWVEFSGSMAAETMKCLNYHSGNVAASAYDLKTVRCSIEIARLLHERPPNFQFLIHSTFWRFLGLLPGLAERMRADISKDIASVIHYMEVNVRDHISVEQMAAIARMPIETFRKRFTAETGIPPAQFLLKRKITLSKELLADKSLTVKEISSLVGISDPYHFSKLFKRYEGVSPDTFRKSFYPEFFD